MPKNSEMLPPSERERLMREAIAEAKLGVSEGEAPIGCVIALHDDNDPTRAHIVARGHNQGNAKQRKNAHAEIMAFEHAGRGPNGEEPTLPMDADNVIMVSTLEPCVMCLGAAMESGVQSVLFGLEAPADNGTQRVKAPESPESSNPDILGGVLVEECRQLFVDWLEDKKGTEQAKFVEQLLALTDGGDKEHKRVR